MCKGSIKKNQWKVTDNDITTEYKTVKDIAEAYNVSVNTIYNMRRMKFKRKKVEHISNLQIIRI